MRQKKTFKVLNVKVDGKQKNEREFYKPEVKQKRLF